MMESNSKQENINPRSYLKKPQISGLHKSHLEAIALELPEGPKHRVNFYSEDEFTNSDISIKIEGIGRLTFPLKGVAKVKFLSACNKVYCEKSQDISHYELPAESVMVVINEEKFAQVLNKIRFEMGFAESCCLEAQQGKMFIHRRDQFHDAYQDPKKPADTVGTLVIVLPFFHLGGNLIIKHGTETHAFNSSNADPEIFKTIGFHADSTYVVEKVTEGFRVALHYNLILKSVPDLCLDVNPNLVRTIQDFLDNFKNEGIENRFVCMLLHNYNQLDLKWHMLRGEDHIRSNALLAVAKHLDLIPYLALVKFKKDKNCVDLNQLRLVKFVNFENEKQGQHTTILTSVKEICWTQETLTAIEHSKLCNEGFGVKKHSAAVVMWPSSMKFELLIRLNYKAFVEKLEAVMKIPGREDEICEIVKKYGNYLRRSDVKCFLFLTEIALYVNVGELSLGMFSHFSWAILNSDIQKCLASLDRHYGADWCNNLLEKLKNPYLQEKHIINNIRQFVSLYLSFGGSHVVLETILSEHLSQILKEISLIDRNLQVKIEYISNFLCSCILIKNSELIDKTINYINSNHHIFSKKVLVNLYSHVKNMISSDDLFYLEPLRLLKTNYQLGSST